MRELALLVVERQPVGGVGRRKATLRAQAEAVEISVATCVLVCTSSIVSISRTFVLMTPSTATFSFGRNRSGPRALGVVFQEEAVRVRALKQSFGDRVVPTARLPMAGVAPA